jgi:hypothetical protein
MFKCCWTGLYPYILYVNTFLVWHFLWELRSYLPPNSAGTFPSSFLEVHPLNHISHSSPFTNANKKQAHLYFTSLTAGRSSCHASFVSLCLCDGWLSMHCVAAASALLLLPLIDPFFPTSKGRMNKKLGSEVKIGTLMCVK